MGFLLALDQGTTSSRAIVFRPDGSVAGVGQREFRQIFPRPGWVEHDPEEIWTSQRDTVHGALHTAGIQPNDLTAVGITNQRETTMVWERSSGRPIANAIVWQDRRTAGMCDRLRAAGHEETFRRKTGLLLDPYFAGTKLAWILDNVDGARARAERGELAFGTVDTWLAYRLCLGDIHVTDASNASRTLLLNLQTGDWDAELLDILKIPRELLPEVRSSSEIYGTASDSSVLQGRVLAGMVGDQQGATLGQLCLEPGQAKNTYGTGCFLLLNTGDFPRPSENRLLTTVGWRMGETTTFCLEGSVFSAGAVVQWLRDGLGLIGSTGEIEALAGSVDDSGGVVFVPALTGLGAPHWDAYARGTIIGLTRGTTAAHLARAALDGIAFSVVDLVDAMESDAAVELGELRVDGGAAANDLLLQIQADLLQRPVVRPKVLETTALGAAYLAGLATGVYDSPAELTANWREDRRFEPRIGADEAAERRARWHEALRRSRNWEPVDKEH